MNSSEGWQLRAIGPAAAPMQCSLCIQRDSYANHSPSRKARVSGMYNEFVSALDKATVDTTLYLTAELRNRARKDGWDGDVANGLRVVNSDGNLHVKFPDEVADRAWFHEYGNIEQTPTATLRKFDNNPDAAGSFLAKRLGKHMGWSE